MSWRSFLALVLFAAVTEAPAATPAHGVDLVHFDRLTGLRLSADGVMLDPVSASARPLRLEFTALGRSFELELEPNASLIQAMRASAIDSSIVPFVGRIAGAAGSWASIVVADGVPAGLIHDGTELYAIEAPGDGIVDNRSVIVFRLKDAVVAPGAMSCASAPLKTNGADAFKSTVSELKTALARAPGASVNIDLGAVADFEFSTARGGQAEAAIITRLNNVDVLFSEQVGVQIDVPLIEIFDSADDPFSDTLLPNSLLQQVASYRSTSVQQRNLGLTHLYTGRDLEGTTVGVAYTGSLCDNFYSAGLSEGNRSATFDSLVAAHEIGHNFGAPHDGGSGNCEAVVGDYIMSSTLNDSDRFSACSIEQMQPVIAAAHCINPLPSTDISLAGPAAPPPILLTNAATLTFDVINNGTEPAENVGVDVTLPVNTALVAASASVGSCTDGAGTVSCELGTIGDRGAATVTLSATTTAAGAGTFEAAVFADSDDDSLNNTANVAITVNPAVELVARPPLPIEIAVDASRTVTLRLDNESPLPATGVTLDVAVGAGLAVTSASWPMGECTVAIAEVSCAAAQFEPVSSVTLSLGVTGVTTGNQPVTVGLTAAETDADPANNSATVSFKVIASASASDEDGGGGSTGLGMLLVLLACGARRQHFAKIRS